MEALGSANLEYIAAETNKRDFSSAMQKERKNYLYKLSSDLPTRAMACTPSCTHIHTWACNTHSKFFLKNCVRCGEMTQQIKYLLSKHEDPS